MNTPKIQIRIQEICDAKRFYEILRNPNFIYFTADPKSVEDEEAWLKIVPTKLANETEYHFTILYDNEVVGAIGVTINNPGRKYIGEIGYFVDEEYWGKGIATEAVKLLEEKCFSDYGITRIEILMRPENVGSEKVAIKSGYTKEGLLRSYIPSKIKKEGLKDVYIYSKIK